MEKLRKPTHPGEVFLQDVLLPLGLSVTNAANLMGISRKALSEFVNEKIACSPLMALRIAQVTNTSAESWLAMQLKVDLWKARQKNKFNLKVFSKAAVL